ncbi:hypothetical protein [Silicimonas algicola]|uniref:hypothetical protein n=1 Tax=Silicimonas algicola TaxID=1826607 RepID=UPI0011B2791E|nr:hypothetical protein [Silicimonas algicola]
MAPATKCGATTRIRARRPRSPTANSAVPVPGLSPGEPSGRSILIFGETKQIRSARGANSCHHRAEVLSARGDPIAVLEELRQPRDLGLLVPERRVHPDEAVPACL